jgi:hypothetical protein
MPTSANKQARESAPKASSGKVGSSPAYQTPSASPNFDPDALTPEMVEQLQSTHGNQFVQRLVAQRKGEKPVTVSAHAPSQAVQRNGDLPSLDGLSDMAKALLEGVLEKTTIDEAVLQIYKNTFSKTGWKYNASIPNAVGKSFIDEGKNVGMCESYRNAFAYILGIYDNLRKTHPTDAVKNGALKIDNGDVLVNDRFYTKSGLTLMGASAIKGNVYEQVDDSGKMLQEGLGTINTFIFRGHWTLIVNGVEYDPIFYAPGVPTLGGLLDAQYASGKVRYLANKKQAIPTGEFGATFVQVTDYPAFAERVKAINDHYTTNKRAIDWMLDSNFLQRWKSAIFKMRNASVVRQGRALYNLQVPDVANFEKVFALAYDNLLITRDQKKAYDKIKQLASI